MIYVSHLHHRWTISWYITLRYKIEFYTLRQKDGAIVDPIILTVAMGASWLISKWALKQEVRRIQEEWEHDKLSCAEYFAQRDEAERVRAARIAEEERCSKNLEHRTLEQKIGPKICTPLDIKNICKVLVSLDEVIRGLNLSTDSKSTLDTSFDKLSRAVDALSNADASNVTVRQDALQERLLGFCKTVKKLHADELLRAELKELRCTCQHTSVSDATQKSGISASTSEDMLRFADNAISCVELTTVITCGLAALPESLLVTPFMGGVVVPE